MTDWLLRAGADVALAAIVPARRGLTRLENALYRWRYASLVRDVRRGA